MNILETIPTDIWRLIFGYNRQPLTIIKTKLTCKLFNDIITKDEELSKILIKIQKDVRNVERCMAQAAKDGDVELVHLCISRGACNWRKGFIGAIKGHNNELIELFKSKPFAGDPLDILETAVRVGNRKLVAALLEEKWVAPSCTIAAAAAEVMDMELVEFFVAISSVTGWSGWDYAMKGAARGGHKELIDLCIKKGANRWDMGLQGAAAGGHRDLIPFFISKGASQIFHAIRFAMEKGHEDLTRELYEMHGPWEVGCSNWLLEEAAFYGNINLVKFFIQKGARTIDSALRKAADRNGDMEIIKYLVECGANNFNEDILEDGHWFKPELAKYFLEKRNGKSLEQYKKEWYDNLQF